MTNAWRIATLHQSLAPCKRETSLLAVCFLIALVGHVCVAGLWPSLKSIAEAARRQTVLAPPPPEESLQYIVLPDAIEEDETVDPQAALAQGRNSRKAAQKEHDDPTLPEGDPTSTGKSNVNNSVFEAKPSSPSEPALAQILPQALAQDAVNPVRPSPPTPPSQPVQTPPVTPQPHPERQQPSADPVQPEPLQKVEAPVLSALPPAPQTDALTEAPKETREDIPEPVVNESAKPDMQIAALPKTETTAAPRPSRLDSPVDEPSKMQQQQPERQQTQDQQRMRQPSQSPQPEQPQQPPREQRPRTPPPIKKIGPQADSQDRKSAVTRNTKARLSSTDSLALLKSRYGAYMDKVIVRLEQSVRRMESLGLGATGKGLVKTSFRIDEHGEIVDIKIIEAPEAMLREQNIVRQIYDDAHAQGKFAPPGNTMLKDPDFSPIIVNFWFE